MKKIAYILASFLVVCAFAPATFAADSNVEIKSIEEISKTDGVTVKAEPSFEGLNLSFNVSFSQVEDSIEYKITLKNNTDTDYKLSEETPFDDSDYITYGYSFSDEILEANSDLSANLVITYAHQVPSNAFANNSYTVNSAAVVKLLTANGDPANPNTADENYRFVIGGVTAIVIAVALISILSKRRKCSKYGVLGLILAICVIPAIAFAATNIKLTATVKIEILNPSYTVSYFAIDWMGYYSPTKYKLVDCDNDYIYVGSRTEENKYQFCRAIYEDPNEYEAGETVQLEALSLESIRITGWQDCELDNDDENGHIAVCSPDDVETVTTPLTYWNYEKQASDNFDYPFNLNDKNIMNFYGNVLDGWDNESNPYLVINTPASFTMPNHDVLFIYIPPAV